MSVVPFDSSSCFSDHVYDFRPNCTSLSSILSILNIFGNENHKKSNSFKKAHEGISKRWLAYWMYDAIEILKKVNVWNSLENTRLNTWWDPCNVSQSERFSLTRAGRTWWFDYNSYLWAFEPNILYRIVSFKSSLTHLLPSSAILQILMTAISLDIT